MRTLGALLLALATGGCSLILSFDELDGGDAAIGDGGVDTLQVDAGVDRFEPNETPMTATPILPGTLDQLAIFPDSDIDYFKFDAPGGQDIVIEVLYHVVGGDIDVRLFDSTLMTPIGAGSSTDDNEIISKTAAAGNQLAAGTYYIQVYSALMSNTYSLRLTVGN